MTHHPEHPPDCRLSWKVYHILSDPLSAVQHYIKSLSTGQIILHLNQGKVCTVEWREKVKDTPDSQSSALL